MPGWFRAAWAIVRGTITEYRRPHGSVLDCIAAELGGHADRASLSGRQRGVAVSFRFATRGSGSDAIPWTEIEAELPRYPLSIHVQRPVPWFAISSNAINEIMLDRAGFDPTFFVEAAPADVARALLDAPTRCALATYDVLELDTVDSLRSPTLRLAIRGWIEDSGTAILLIDQIARLAARVRDVYAEVELAARTRMDGAPYRQHVDDAPSRDAHAAREAEVSTLDHRRFRRSRGQMIAVLAILAILVFCAIASKL